MPAPPAAARVWARWDFAGGRADLEAALLLNPSDAASLRAFAEDILLPAGKLPEAIATARRASVLDPVSTSTWTLLGLALASTPALLDETGQAFDRALEISPKNDHAALHRGTVDVLQGRAAQALARVPGSPPAGAASPACRWRSRRWATSARPARRWRRTTPRTGPAEAR